MSNVSTMREIFEYSARQWKQDRIRARTAEQFKAAQEHLEACRKQVQFWRSKEKEISNDNRQVPV